MKSVSVSWDKEGGRFVALGSHAGHPIAINAPRAPEETRGSTGFSATELLLAGAGACSAWDVVEIVRKRRHQISSLDVTVEGEQQVDPPWTYRRVALHYRVTGEGLSFAVIGRVIRLSVVRYCSVIATVSAAADIVATVELVGPDGSTTGRRPIELAIPAQIVAVADEEALGVEEPIADEEGDGTAGAD
ncbi:MAG: OsmC family protein [Candidatus Limnocylindrales bacterium]